MHTAYLAARTATMACATAAPIAASPSWRERLGAGGAWPLRRHLAVVDAEACTGAAAVRRCPFGAITIDRHREPALRIEAADCRGCGLCATGCSEGAVEMAPRATSA